MALMATCVTLDVLTEAVSADVFPVVLCILSLLHTMQAVNTTLSASHRPADMALLRALAKR